VPARFVAPYNADPDTWHRYDYTDIHTQQTAPGRLLVELASLDVMLPRWHSNPETVGNGPDGQLCDPTTEGLLNRRTIISAEPLITLIGKEAGSVETEDDPGKDQASTHLTMYPRQEMLWRTVAAAVRRLGIANVARRAGLSERGLRKGLNPETTPHQKTRDTVLHAAADAAREVLRLDWKDDLRVLAAYTRTPRLCQRCGTPLPNNADSRRKYCPEVCNRGS
jgi:hypothetical protein